MKETYRGKNLLKQIAKYYESLIMKSSGIKIFYFFKVTSKLISFEYSS